MRFSSLSFHAVEWKVQFYVKNIVKSVNWDFSFASFSLWYTKYSNLVFMFLNLIALATSQQESAYLRIIEKLD